MSALRMIAWGMVDVNALSPKEFRDLRQQVRDELRHNTHLRLIGSWGSNSFTLNIVPDTHTSKRTKRYKRSRITHRGTLESCCRTAFNLLYPKGTENA